MLYLRKMVVHVHDCVHVILPFSIIVWFSSVSSGKANKNAVPAKDGSSRSRLRSDISIYSTLITLTFGEGRLIRMLYLRKMVVHVHDCVHISIYSTLITLMIALILLPILVCSSTSISLRPNYAYNMHSILIDLVVSFISSVWRDAGTNAGRRECAQKT